MPSAGGVLPTKPHRVALPGALGHRTGLEFLNLLIELRRLDGVEPVELLGDPGSVVLLEEARNSRGVELTAADAEVPSEVFRRLEDLIRDGDRRLHAISITRVIPERNGMRSNARVKRRGRSGFGEAGGPHD